MSRLFLFLAAFLLCTSLSAADIRDTWFETLYEGSAKQLPEGCQIRKDAAKRIIFLDMPLPIKSSQSFDVKVAKAQLIKAIKGTPDADFIRKAEILVIYNYITTDHKIYSVVIGKDDL
ncbi:MAG: hypothetical protein J6331_01340 [Lentisphaeria bacterium]|nr:hypothetical protein [Lentisphaeria bacterium]